MAESAKMYYSGVPYIKLRPVLINFAGSLVIKNVQTRAIYKGTSITGATTFTGVAWRGQLWGGV